MIDQMARPRPTALRMPVQAAPVYRAGSTGALGAAPGVEADGIFDFVEDVVSGVKQALPIAQAAAPLLAGLI